MTDPVRPVEEWLRSLLAQAFDAGHYAWPTVDNPTRGELCEAAIDKILAVAPVPADAREELTNARLAVNDWHACATQDELNRWRQVQLRLIDAAKAVGRAETARSIAAAPVPCAASPADEWQPIETAPKDGTQVWAWDDERGSNPALFACEAEAWLITYDDAVIHPTLWMPLPTPPRATGEGARDAVYESDSRHAHNAAPERRRDATAMDAGAADARDAAAADTGRMGRAEGHRAGDHAGLPPERSAVDQADESPVAVSLDPHRLPSLCRFMHPPQSRPCSEVHPMFHDKWCGACLMERYEPERFARLRGEATVRPVDEQYASRAEYENHRPWCRARQFNSLNVAKCTCDLKSATVRVEE
jgi:hypothetical protein